MACEVGLYYVLHITKQRNKNALLRLLPGLGEWGCPPAAAASLPLAPLRAGSLHWEGFVSGRCLGTEARGAQPCALTDALCSSPLVEVSSFHGGVRAPPAPFYLAGAVQPLKSSDVKRVPPALAGGLSG